MIGDCQLVFMKEQLLEYEPVLVPFDHLHGLVNVLHVLGRMRLYASLPSRENVQQEYNRGGKQEPLQ